MRRLSSGLGVLTSLLVLTVACSSPGGVPSAPGALPAGGVVVQPGAPLPMLHDIDPEDLDATRDVPGVPSVATARPSASADASAEASVRYRDGWTVTVLRLVEQATTPDSPLPTGMRLVTVTLRIENHGTVGAQAFPSEFKLQDGNALRRDVFPCVGCRGDQLIMWMSAPVAW